MFHRSALDENREINHHGLSVSVGGKDSQADSTIISFDKNLISRDEKVQNTALKYVKKGLSSTLTTLFCCRARYKFLASQRKNRHRLHVCHTIGHKVMPSIAVWFVISYWTTGYAHILEIEQRLNIAFQITFTAIWFGSFILLNIFWGKLCKRDAVGVEIHVTKQDIGAGEAMK